MEKWAKTLNSQKEAQRDAFRKMFQPSNPLQKKEAATADAGFAIMEKSVSAALVDMRKHLLKDVHYIYSVQIL